MRKTCSHCGETKLITSFYKSSASNDGHQRWCKLCSKTRRKEFMKANPTKRRQYRREKEREAEHTYRRSEKGRYKCLKSAAKRRNLPITITFEQYVQLLKNPCSYCGGVFGKDVAGSGLDRIDNAQGYTPQNVLRACGVCNETRGSNWTVAETRKVIALIKKMRKLG